MINCRIVDETDDPNYESNGTFERTFSRIPTVGEHVIVDGRWLKIVAVGWRHHSTDLVVKWDRGLDECPCP